MIFQREKIVVLEEFLVLVEGYKIGSPFGQYSLLDSLTGTMYEGRFHANNIRKKLFFGNRHNTKKLCYLSQITTFSGLKTRRFREVNDIESSIFDIHFLKNLKPAGGPEMSIEQIPLKLQVLFLTFLYSITNFRYSSGDGIPI